MSLISLFKIFILKSNKKLGLDTKKTKQNKLLSFILASTNTHSLLNKFMIASTLLMQVLY